MYLHGQTRHGACLQLRRMAQGRYRGMQISHEDLEWLRRLALQPGSDLPPFNRGRLIAMCLLEISDEGLVLTMRGKAELRSQRRRANRGDPVSSARAPQRGVTLPGGRAA
jgi:hypothetical protein